MLLPSVVVYYAVHVDNKLVSCFNVSVALDQNAY